MDELRQLLADVRSFDILLFRLGDTDITIFGLVKLALLIAALFIVTGRIDSVLRRRVLERTPLDLPARVMLAAIVRYLMLLLGFLIIIQSSGINLTSLNVLAGALGVGVGFGLQNIVSNFMSGLIIMFERSIKVGDRIELGNVEGEVLEIGARRTTLLTNDNLTYIVPNSRFITENVANLHYRADTRVRVRTQISVAAGADPRAVRSLLLEAAAENPHVLKTPEPQVRLVAYQGGGAMAFELMAWNQDLIAAREMLVSELNFQIGDKLTGHEIKLA